MKVLIVASYNKGYYAPFILEQAQALRLCGVTVDFFGVTGKGIKGYIKAFPELKDKISEFAPDIIHAHYGLCGLLANLQRRVPVITTYHGSDINEKSVLPFSKLSMRLSKHNVFVSKKNVEIAGARKKYSLIPCGINLPETYDKGEARSAMNLLPERKYVLFAGAFDNGVKNYPLARAAMDLLPDAELIELKGYGRSEVNMLMCAADAILMTSLTEGSPQVIKEAMVCGLPVVSVDAGDVAELTAGVEGCHVCDREPSALAEALEKAVGSGRTEGMKRILERGLTNDLVAQKVLDIYKSVI